MGNQIVGVRQSEALLTINTIEGAQLVFGRQQIDAQRRSQSPGPNRAVHNVFLQRNRFRVCSFSHFQLRVVLTQHAGSLQQLHSRLNLLGGRLLMYFQNTNAVLIQIGL